VRASFTVVAAGGAGCDDGWVRVLIPLPDRDFDVTEVAVPWQLLREGGHQAVFATEQAGTIPAGDPRLLDGVIFGPLGAAPEARAFYAELTRAAEFTSPVAWAGLDPAAFDGLLLPGGHAPGMRQYLGSPVLREQSGSRGALPLINNPRVPVSLCGLCSPRTWRFSSDPA
jgi:hypothetical protein